MNKITKLNDGSAFTIMSIPRKKFIKRWKHKLFDCPTFWCIKPRFQCPRCGKKYRCYWDGNDVTDYGIDYCDKCANYLEDK